MYSGFCCTLGGNQIRAWLLGDFKKAHTTPQQDRLRVPRCPGGSEVGQKGRTLKEEAYRKGERNKGIFQTGFFLLSMNAELDMVMYV